MSSLLSLAKSARGLDVDRLTRDECVALAEVLDNSLAAVCGCALAKAGEGERLPFEEAMAELLLTNWSSASRGAIETVTKRLAAQEGEFTEAQVTEIMRLVREQVDTKFVRPTSSGLPNIFVDSYSGAKAGVLRQQRKKLTIDNFDEVAVNWLGEHHVYWVGNYYDNHVAGNLATNLLEGIKAGERRDVLGQRVKTFFDDYPGVPARPDSYWTGFATNAANRSRQFGEIAGYEEIGVETLEVVAVMDERTSEVCQAMHGTIFTVKQAASQRDRLMAANDPEDVKAIAPWPKLSQITNQDGTLPSDQLASRSVVLPPYHWRCRTIVVSRA